MFDINVILLPVYLFRALFNSYTVKVSTAHCAAVLYY
jgi:hypothetical protein